MELTSYLVLLKYSSEQMIGIIILYHSASSLAFSPSDASIQTSTDVITLYLSNFEYWVATMEVVIVWVISLAGMGIQETMRYGATRCSRRMWQNVCTWWTHGSLAVQSTGTTSSLTSSTTSMATNSRQSHSNTLPQSLMSMTRKDVTPMMVGHVADVAEDSIGFNITYSSSNRFQSPLSQSFVIYLEKYYCILLI